MVIYESEENRTLEGIIFSSAAATDGVGGGAEEGIEDSVLEGKGREEEEEEEEEEKEESGVIVGSEVVIWFA